MIFRRREFEFKELSRKFLIPLQEVKSPTQLYPMVLKAAVESMDAEGGSLVLFQGEDFEVKECLGWNSFSFRKEECLPFIQWLQKNRQVITRTQIVEDPQFSYIKGGALHFFVQFQAEVCIPIFCHNSLAGFINLGTRKEGRDYHLGAIDVLEWLGAQFAFALHATTLEEERSKQTEIIRQYKDLRNQMLANLSHELRTPLTGIIGFAELLQEEVDGTLNEYQKQYVGKVLEGGNRLLDLLSTLVDLAKLEAGSHTLNVRHFHLAPVVSRLVEQIPLSEKIQLSMHLNGGTPRIYGDLGMVQQIFKHLLENAAKYTEEGFIRVGAEKKGEELEICVEDSGVGIALEKQEWIFEGFRQAEGGADRLYSGTGLGLAVARRLVQLHGGRMWVKSKPGQGSRFYFTLPLKPVGLRYKELAA